MDLQAVKVKNELGKFERAIRVESFPTFEEFWNFIIATLQFLLNISLKRLYKQKMLINILVVYKIAYILDFLMFF